MTSKEFQKIFRRIRRKYNFHKSHSRFYRGVYEGNEFCPITAVYFEKTGRFVDENNAQCCADELNIALDVTKRIIRTADSSAYVSNNSVWKKLFSQKN